MALVVLPSSPQLKNVKLSILSLDNLCFQIGLCAGPQVTVLSNHDDVFCGNVVQDFRVGPYLGAYYCQIQISFYQWRSSVFISLHIKLMSHQGVTQYLQNHFSAFFSIIFQTAASMNILYAAKCFFKIKRQQIVHFLVLHLVWKALF